MKLEVEVNSYKVLANNFKIVIENNKDCITGTIRDLKTLKEKLESSLVETVKTIEKLESLHGVVWDKSDVTEDLPTADISDVTDYDTTEEYEDMVNEFNRGRLEDIIDSEKE